MPEPGRGAGHLLAKLVALAKIGQFGELCIRFVRLGYEPVGPQGYILDDAVELWPQRQIEGDASRADHKIENETPPAAS